MASLPIGVNTLPKACVILGAGASFDVRGEGSPAISSAFRPPLAKDLFDIEKHPTYWEILNRYSGAKVLTQRLAPLISSGQVSIENALRKYAEHQDTRIRSHFKHVPAYLRDLLHAASFEYTYMPSSYIELAIELLAEHPHDVLFMILNYDTLLETALNYFDNGFRFSNITDYIASDRPAKVVKFHGSTNWFVHIPQKFGMEWDNAIKQFDIFAKATEKEILIKSEVSEVRNHVDNGHLLYPLLTAPLAGKGVSDAVCPESHIKAAQEFLRGCQKFLIIGTSGLDEDLLSLLNSTLGSSKLYYHIHIVGDGKGADEARFQFVKYVKAFANCFPEDNVYKAGFRHYLKEGLKAFTEVRM
jgi:hypothetical protein